jgi:hypothetical protein
MLRLHAVTLRRPRVLRVHRQVAIGYCEETAAPLAIWRFPRKEQCRGLAPAAEPRPLIPAHERRPVLPLVVDPHRCSLLWLLLCLPPLRHGAPEHAQTGTLPHVDILGDDLVQAVLEGVAAGRVADHDGLVDVEVHDEQRPLFLLLLLR